MTYFNWSDDRKARVKALDALGYSASQIAADLGCSSRNAVIGVIHRMGLRGDSPLLSKAAIVSALRQAPSPPRSFDPPPHPDVGPPLLGRSSHRVGLAASPRQALRKSPARAPVAKEPRKSEKPAKSKPVIVGAVPREHGPDPLQIVKIKSTGVGPSLAADDVVTLVAAAEGKGKSLLALHPSDCRWPIGDPGRGNMHLQRFCAVPRVDGKPYCASHCAVAHVKTPLARAFAGADMKARGEAEKRVLHGARRGRAA